MVADGIRLPVSRWEDDSAVGPVSSQRSLKWKREAEEVRAM